MNLMQSKEGREVFSVHEIATYLSLKPSQIRYQVTKGNLRRGGKGVYAFLQSDVNSFITRLNAGKIDIGRCGHRVASLVKAFPTRFTTNPHAPSGMIVVAQPIVTGGKR